MSAPALRKRLMTSPPGWRFCRASRSSGTGAERRREFAELLFSRVTVDQYSRTRDWALNNPFQRLFEFAQPGSKLVLDGDPNRTSFELILNTNVELWLSAANV